MQLRHISIIILPINQIMNFRRVGICVSAGEIHQAPNTVGLFADIIVFFLQFDEVFCGEGDGLGAGEVEVFAVEELCDFVTELVCEIGLGFDAYFIEIGDCVAHFDVVFQSGIRWLRACMKCGLAES